MTPVAHLLELVEEQICAFGEGGWVDGIERFEYLVASLGRAWLEPIIVEVEVADVALRHARFEESIDFLEKAIGFAASANTGNNFNEVSDAGG